MYETYISFLCMYVLSCFRCFIASNLHCRLPDILSDGKRIAVNTHPKYKKLFLRHSDNSHSTLRSQKFCIVPFSFRSITMLTLGFWFNKKRNGHCIVIKHENNSNQLHDLSMNNKYLTYRSQILYSHTSI